MQSPDSLSGGEVISNVKLVIRTIEGRAGRLIGLGSVVRRPDSAIQWIALFSTFAKLAVDRYNLRLRFGIYKLKFLRSIVGSRSVVSQLALVSFTKVALFAIRWIAYPGFVQPAPGLSCSKVD